MRVETLRETVVERIVHGRLVVPTHGEGMTDVSAAVVGWVRGLGAVDGLLTLFVRHTTASLAIQENADRRVQADLIDGLDRMAPRTVPYRHSEEGTDDMPGHIKAMICGSSLSVPVRERALVLGTWQGLYLVEHRDGAWCREIAITFVGTTG